MPGVVAAGVIHLRPSRTTQTMASRIVSRSLALSLQKAQTQQVKILSILGTNTRNKAIQTRFFASGDNVNKNNNEKDASVAPGEEEPTVVLEENGKDSKLYENIGMDPFGVHFDDSQNDGLGANLPPLYERDAATGRLTGQVQAELSAEDKEALQEADNQEILRERLSEQWNREDMDRLGARVRAIDLGTNVLGRSVKKGDDGDQKKVSEPLSQSEYETFAAFMEQRYGVDNVTDDDLPVQEEKPKQKRGPDKAIDPDHSDLALKWLTARAQRQMDESLNDSDPYADLSPSDLNPTRLVNRQRAKPIPVTQLHHNNIPLLQRYLTPSGQIRNRVQTRLGARDQRRITKLIKRARCLGLLPTVGQFKTETHGWVHEEGLREDKHWEEELKKRGLVVQPKEKSI